MIIRSRDFTYEVIQQFDCSREIRHYRCRCRPDGGDYLLVEFPAQHQVGTLPARVLDLQEQAAFTDLQEFFTGEEGLILVFPYPQGRSLDACLTAGEWELSRRYQAGQQVLEQLLLLQMPEWLLSGILHPAAVYPESEPPGFFYLYSGDGRVPEPADIGGQFEQLFTALFAPEAANKQYPELQAFLTRLADPLWWTMNAAAGNDNHLLAVYQAYLELMPVCLAPKAEPAAKEPWKDKLRRWGKRLVTAFKLLMGAAVLLTALTMIPAFWREQVVPVAEAAMLWKAVYVDGETPAAEETAPIETEPETEPETDPDNGLVVRYWESGKVSYRGMMKDGLFDGEGTRYYANGLLEYQGEFSFGRKDGEGCLYSPGGGILYEGGFKRDRYDGQGRLYDENTGALIYDGEFSGGKYNGQGFLFDPFTEFPVYSGTFRQGLYDGQGVEFGDNGIRLYEGEFLLGVYHGSGVYYDTATGAAMLEGEFRNGLLVVPKETEDDIGADGMMPEDGTAAGGELAGDAVMPAEAAEPGDAAGSAEATTSAEAAGPGDAAGPGETAGPADVTTPADGATSAAAAIPADITTPTETMTPAAPAKEGEMGP